MSFRKMLLHTSVLSLGLAVPALAQTAPAEDDLELTPIIVTATRSAKAIDKIPGAVTVISTKELEAQFQISDDPSAALTASVPGYTPSRQKLTSTGESVRGRGVLIMLDGIPQGNPLRDARREGYFVDSTVISSIEVVSGASAIHGMGATGGIINYITRSPEEGTHHKLDIRALSQFRDDNLEIKGGYTLTHKSDLLDFLGYVAYQRRGMLYDGKGDLIGVDSAVGDSMDSHGNNVFVKLGKDFDAQRVQFTLNRFRIYGDGDYREVAGNAVAGVPTTSEKGFYPVGKAAFNRVRSMSFAYSNADFLGGSLDLQLFNHRSFAQLGPDIAPAAQDPHIAPVGTLYDQNALTDRKDGAKLTYVRPDLLVEGLELTAGVDQIFAKTEQYYTITNRIWMPELDYQATAPFTQLEYNWEDITVRGGVRYEDGRLKVDDYRTVGYYGRLNNGYVGHLVSGGERDFSKLVKNIGGVWRFGDGLSAFAAYSEGFGLPDVGILLRTVSLPNKDVDDLFDLKPIVTKSREIGANWRQHWGHIGFSLYESESKFGSALRVGTDGLGELVRVPTRVRGLEATAEWRPVREVSLNASYALTRGKTAEAVGRPLDLALGGRNQGPDKLNLGAEWRFQPGANVRIQASHFFDRDVNEGRGTLRNGRYLLEEHFDGYTLFDLNASLDTDYGRFGLGIENIFDKYYVTYFSQSVRYAVADADEQYFAGHGRTLSLSWSREF